jgi:hypothetical protein
MSHRTLCRSLALVRMALAPDHDAGRAAEAN